MKPPMCGTRKEFQCSRFAAQWKRASSEGLASFSPRTSRPAQVEAEAAHGAFGGLLGRGSRQHDPGDAIAQLAQQDSAKLLGDAQRRLGRPVRMETRSGRVEREVVAAVAPTDLLVCAQRRPTPAWTT